MKILSFGEILWDIINGVEHLGGAPFNFAAHSAKCGNESYILSRVGGDVRGIKAFNKCTDYGVNNTFLQLDQERPTGTVEVVLNDGQPDYTILDNVAYDFITYDNLVNVDKKLFDVFYFGSLAQCNVTSALTLRSILKNFSFKHIFYDVNLRKSRYNKAIVMESLKWCTILKLNSDEVPVISMMLYNDTHEFDRFCELLKNDYPQLTIIVITASEKGCYVFPDQRLEYVPGKKVTVHDAVGAGDAFSAAFMHVFSRTNDPVGAASTANELGAYVATQPGAIPDYSSEIRHLLQSGRESYNTPGVL